MIAFEELFDEAVWCEGRSAPGFAAVAVTLRRAASTIAELDAKLTEAIEICRQTARGAVKAQDIMDRQSKRIAELETTETELRKQIAELEAELADLQADRAWE